MQNKPQYLIDLDVRLTWHKMSRMYNQRANSYGISMSVGFILLHIDREGTPSTQLGPRMGMEPTSLSRTLKTMEEKGFIRREEDKLDKRIVRIFLTEEGLKDSVFPDNIPFTKDGKMAFIDTEHHHLWPVDYYRLERYLSPEMKTYWKNLTHSFSP